VNGVAPGAIADSQLQGPRALGLESFKQSDIPKDAMLSTFRGLTLMPELPTPLGYAPVYAFLASHHNTVVTGQTVLLEQGALNRAALSTPGATGGIGT
jgi:NAD(P)-dependent dehydrogenase (short-subunit alcohol dehydrogenase family)